MATTAPGNARLLISASYQGAMRASRAGEKPAPIGSGVVRPCARPLADSTSASKATLTRCANLTIKTLLRRQRRMAASASNERSTARAMRLKIAQNEDDGEG